jgi:amidase
MDVRQSGRLMCLVMTVLFSLPSTAHAHAPAPPVESRLEYLSVDEISRRMERNELSAAMFVLYLQRRIAALDKQGPKVNAVIELNPEALAIAEFLDRERKSGYVRGPLHGIPVLLKDNIDTSDQMQTSAGSLAMVGDPPAKDAFIVQRLREAGAIILGKTNLSDWAACRDPALPGSAAATAAGFAPLAVGTETAGSIICPASLNGVVGIKPTVGLLSRSGIIPVTHKLDTPGPMARTVREAALLLNAMRGSDPADPVRKPHGQDAVDYTALLRPNTLVGKRIGYPAKFDRSGLPLLLDPQFSQALELIQAAGATLIPVDLKDPSSARLDEAFQMGIQRELPRYLATRTGIPAQTLNDLLLFNAANAEGPGQATLIAASKVVFDEQTYNHLWGMIQGENAAAIDRLLVTHQLDALVSDVASPAMNVAPLAGYPGVMVPTGIDDEGAPTSIFFYGPRWSEAQLLALAYGYEQVSNARRAPEFKP